MFVICLISDAVDYENESVAVESKVAKEAIDFKEVRRVDHILASLQRKVILIKLKHIFSSISSFQKN